MNSRFIIIAILITIKVVGITSGFFCLNIRPIDCVISDFGLANITVFRDFILEKVKNFDF